MACPAKHYPPTLAVLLWLFAVPASAQIVEINGGSSSLYGASGAGVTLHFPDSTLSTSGGISNGHFRLGAAESFRFLGYDITAGDFFSGFSAAGSSVAVPERGFAVSRRKLPVCFKQPIPAARWTHSPLWGVVPCSPETKLTFFVGGTGDAFQNPFFSSASMTHFGAGVDYERIYRSGLTLSTLVIVAPLRNTALAGLEWKRQSLRLQAGGGLLQDSPYWNAQADYQPSRHAVFSVAHSTYIFSGQSVSVDSLSGAAMVSRFDFHGTWLVRGYDYGTGIRLGWFAAHAEFAKATRFYSFNERIGRHLQISEYVSGRSPSFGAEYQSNRFSAGWSQQIFYYPFLGRFQQTTSAHFSFRVRDALVNLAGLIPPAGRPLYTVAGNDYLQGPYAGSLGMTQHAGSFGRYEIRGTVTDESGQAVAGAAVQIGKALAYTNQAGEFSIGARSQKPQPVTVPLSEWATPGQWRVISAPKMATPEQPISVTVARFVL
jgi:hypothetical protein